MNDDQYLCVFNGKIRCLSFGFGFIQSLYHTSLLCFFVFCPAWLSLVLHMDKESVAREVNRKWLVAPARRHEHGQCYSTTDNNDNAQTTSPDIQSLIMIITQRRQWQRGWENLPLGLRRRNAPKKRISGAKECP